MDSPPYSKNASLRFGFEWDRDYLTTILMIQQFYMPIIGSLTIHPIIFYLLINENRSMLSGIRIGYFFIYFILVLDEWSFCFFFRVLPLPPYAALYCEGQLCNSGLDKQWLMALFSSPVVLANIPFDFLVVIMHQMFVPVGSKAKLSNWVMSIMVILHLSLMAANITAWGVFGKECAQSEIIKEEPELIWLRERGGSVFMFGPPGEPEYLGRTLILYAITVLIISPFMAFFTGDAMRRMAMANLNTVSSGTQAATRRMFGVFLVQLAWAAVSHVGPLFIMFGFMAIDGSWIPGPILAFGVRFAAVVVFNTKSYAFGIFLLLKNPNYQKAILLLNKGKRLLGKEVEVSRVRSTYEPTKTMK